MGKGVRSVIALAVAVIVLPLGTYLLLPHLPPLGNLPEPFSGGSTFPASPLSLDQGTIGPKPFYRPRITNVQIVDFDRDGLPDVIVCDAQTHRVLWYRQAPRGHWQERILGEDPLAPAHATVVDLDQDGDLDVVVAILGNIYVDDGVIGRVVLLDNDGGRFTSRVLLTDVRRVADVQAGDLDGDGDVDLLLSVGDNFEDQYGYPQPYHGCLWLENQGGWNFVPQRIATFGGTYAAATGDLDADGDQDVVLVSMFNEWDKPGRATIVWLENDDRQQFRTWQIAEQPTHLVTVACGDLNGDGRADIVAGGLHVPPPFHKLGRITTWISREGGSP